MTQEHKFYNEQEKDAFYEDRKKQRDHEWRVGNPGAFLIDSLIDNISIIVCVAIVCATFYGCSAEISQ